MRKDDYERLPESGGEHGMRMRRSWSTTGLPPQVFTRSDLCAFVMEAMALVLLLMLIYQSRTSGPELTEGVSAS